MISEAEFRSLAKEACPVGEVKFCCNISPFALTRLIFTCANAFPDLREEAYTSNWFL